MTDYPERRPASLKPVESFHFSLKGMEDTKRECDLQLSALGERIKRIAEKKTVTMNGQPFNIIDKILDICRDKAELKGLAQGIDRVAEIIERYDELDARARILDIIEKDPTWLAWAFGDFESELEADLANLDIKLSEIEANEP